MVAFFFNFHVTATVLLKLGIFFNHMFGALFLLLAQAITIYIILKLLFKLNSKHDKWFMVFVYIAVLYSLFFKRNIYRYESVVIGLNPLSFIADMMKDSRNILFTMANAMMFIPLPFLLHLFNVHKFKNMLIINLIFSILLELSQIITRTGIFDIGDIVVYTFGFIMGYVILRTILKNELTME